MKAEEEIEQLKVAFINEYIDDYVMDAFKSEMLVKLDNLLNAFSQFQNKELIEICTKLIHANKREDVIETIEWTDELEDYLTSLKTYNK